MLRTDRTSSATQPQKHPEQYPQRRQQLTWPAAGVGLAIVLVGVLRPPAHRDLSLGAGVAILAAEIIIVAILSATPTGTRAAVLLSGLMLPLAAYVAATPLGRALLACFGGVPFVTATLLLAPNMPIPRLGGRLAFICSIGGVVARRRPRGIDARALLHLALATAALAVAIAAVKAASPMGFGLAGRWLAGGVGMLAIGEMFTACLPLAAAALGVTTSPLFRSPARSTSLADFWARRWNVRASVFFRHYAFVPLARHGVGIALTFTFLLSALGHAFFADIALGRLAALSCAAFFLAQPLLLAAERRLALPRRWPPFAGWLWTMSALAATSPLLIEPILQTVSPSWGSRGEVLVPTAAGLAFVVVVCTTAAVASLPLVCDCAAPS